MLEVPDWGFGSLFDLDIVTSPCPFSPLLDLWRTLEVPDWGLGSWSWFGYGHWSLMHPWSKYLDFLLILKVQRTYMSFKYFLGLWRTLEVPDWGLASWSWFGYGHWSLIYPLPEFWLLSWFWRCKEHPCPLSPDLGLWRMLEVPDWGLASSSWFEYVHCSLIPLYS